MAIILSWDAGGWNIEQGRHGFRGGRRRTLSGWRLWQVTDNWRAVPEVDRGPPQECVCIRLCCGVRYGRLATAAATYDCTYDLKSCSKYLAYKTLSRQTWPLCRQRLIVPDQASAGQSRWDMVTAQDEPIR